MIKEYSWSLKGRHPQARNGGTCKKQFFGTWGGGSYSRGASKAIIPLCGGVVGSWWQEGPQTQGRKADYDTDDFPADHINRTAELCAQNSTDDIQYHAIWSNQCIELWYLLHFGYFHSDIHRQGYWPKLTEWLKNIEAGEYTKGRPDMYKILKPYMETAIPMQRNWIRWMRENRQPVLHPELKCMNL